MLYLGNPEYGVDLAPVDFVKFAEACGARGLRIEDPKYSRDQLRQGLAIDGPALIECVVDPLEPPWSPEIARDEAEKLVTAMRRGERKHAADRADHRPPRRALSQSPFGIAGRVIDRLTGRREENKQKEEEKEKAE